MASKKTTATELSTIGRQNSGILILSESELADFQRAKTTIREGIATYVSVGLALQQINQNRWYKADGFATFEEFCRAEYDVSRPRAYQLIEAATTALRIESEGGATPATERQARAIAAATKSAKRQSTKRPAVQPENEFCLSDIGITPTPNPELVGNVVQVANQDVPTFQQGELAELRQSYADLKRDFEALATENKALKARIAELEAAAFVLTEAERQHMADCAICEGSDPNAFIHCLFAQDMRRVEESKTASKSEIATKQLSRRVSSKGAEKTAPGADGRQAETGRQEAALPVTAPIASAPKRKGPPYPPLVNSEGVEYPRTVTMYEAGDPRRRNAELSFRMRMASSSSGSRRETAGVA